MEDEGKRIREIRESRDRERVSRARAEGKGKSKVGESSTPSRSYQQDRPVASRGTSGSRAQGTIVCHSCGGQGHIRRDCPSRNALLPPPPQRRVTVCYTCGQEGHISPNCPNRVGTPRQSGTPYQGSSTPQGVRQQSRQATPTAQSRTGRGGTYCTEQGRG